MGRLLHFDCFNGASGDMIVAALFSAGVPFDVVQQAVSSLGLAGCSIRLSQRTVSGIEASWFAVEKPDNAPTETGFSEVKGLVARARLQPAAAERAMKAFRLLFSAEALLHGKPEDQVHLHEAGSADSIIDVVAASVAIEIIKPERITCSPLPVGRGFVRCSHGKLPLPAPATLEILKGLEVYGVDVEGEFVTPTGAAILAANVDGIASFPALIIEAVGYGAGTMSFADRPNMLRVVSGEETRPAETAYVVEANIDDMNPQLYENLDQSLRSAGAADVWLTPVQMKKGRPAILVSAICPAQALEKVGSAFLRESTTIGYRYYKISRRQCERQCVQVTTRFGTVRFKVASERGMVLNAHPEYEDLCRLARAASVPLKDVLNEALASYYREGRLERRNEQEQVKQDAGKRETD